MLDEHASSHRGDRMGTIAACPPTSAQSPFGPSNPEGRGEVLIGHIDAQVSEVPLADPEIYRAMLDLAMSDGHALAAINVSSSETRPFAASPRPMRAGSCRSPWRRDPARRAGPKDRALGAAALADRPRRVADRYPVNVTLTPTTARPRHLTRSCARCWLRRRSVGTRQPSVCAGPDPDRRCCTPRPTNSRELPRCWAGEDGRYLPAAFGNVHGIYAPGTSTCDRPSWVGQDALAANHPESSFSYSFHGGSGSSPEDMDAAIEFGVVRMSLYTDAQYAVTHVQWPGTC